MNSVIYIFTHMQHKSPVKHSGGPRWQYTLKEPVQEVRHQLQQLKGTFVKNQLIFRSHCNTSDQTRQLCVTVRHESSSINAYWMGLIPMFATFALSTWGISLQGDIYILMSFSIKIQVFSSKKDDTSFSNREKKDERKNLIWK